MASKQDICSMAMYLIGCNSVSDLDAPTTEEERACKLWWDQCVKEVLEDHDWKFARGYKVLDGSLALTTSPSEEYDHAYQLPTDCLKLQYLWDADAGCRVKLSEYEIHGALILTDLDTVNIVYTQNDIAVGLFPAFFVSALTYLLGAKCAPKLATNGATQEVLYAHYEKEKGKAIDKDCAQNNYPIDTNQDSWMQAGGFSTTTTPDIPAEDLT
jgi:hypothetical protein